MNLDIAIYLASIAHRGQVDKAGAPYILHPLRVMMRMADDEHRIVAVLHDCIEDSDLTLCKLQEVGFSIRIIEAIDSLTKRSGESYDLFISRVAINAIARAVKIADIEDNLNLARLRTNSTIDFDKVRNYISSLEKLRSSS